MEFRNAVRFVYVPSCFIEVCRLPGNLHMLLHIFSVQQHMQVLCNQFGEMKSLFHIALCLTWPVQLFYIAGGELAYDTLLTHESKACN